VSNNELTVEFVNKKIGNNQWTGIGFGPGMDDLEVVLVKIQDNKPSLVTGFTNGYAPPTVDSAANVAPKLLSFNTVKKVMGQFLANQLTMRFTRPLAANGPRQHSLEECQKWNFVKEGPLEDGKFGPHTATPVSMKVCPKDCTKNVIRD
ncbi:DOMON domain-containing protein, partial [Trichostrongylus colubriformis]